MYCVIYLSFVTKTRVEFFFVQTIYDKTINSIRNVSQNGADLHYDTRTADDDLARIRVNISVACELVSHDAFSLIPVVTKGGKVYVCS